MKLKQIAALTVASVMLFGSVNVQAAGIPITKGEAAAILSSAADDYTSGITPRLSENSLYI